MRAEKKIVEILVTGGVAEPGHIPDGVEVCIKDYDIDGISSEDLYRDEWGWHTLTVWPGGGANK